MLKFILLGWILLLILSCSEPVSVVPSNHYSKEPFFSLDPYPLIEINPDRFVYGVVRPAENSVQIKLEGFNNGVSFMNLIVLDTLSELDQIPHDNTFQFSLNSLVFPESQNISLATTAYGDKGNITWSDTLYHIQAIANNSPQIDTVQISDTLSSDINTWSWSLRAYDPDPEEVLHLEIIAHFSTGWARIFETGDYLSSEGVFVFNNSLDSTDRAGLKGNTGFRFIISDRYQNVADDTLYSFVINNPPVIQETIFPDTLIIIPDTESYSNYFIKVSDTETISDIDSVNVLFYRPDGSFSLNVDWFNDQGEDSDTNAGDGWYTARVGNPNDPKNAGEWTLKAYSVDKAGNRSETISKSLYVR